MSARPFVSCITPTYGRQRFLPYLIYQFNYQTYPASRRELIFLDDFKGQVLQLDPFKVILCIAHSGNTFDKHKLLQQKNSPVVKETKLTLKNFVKDKKLYEFYMQLTKEEMEANKNKPM